MTKKNGDLTKAEEQAIIAEKEKAEAKVEELVKEKSSLESDLELANKAYEAMCNSFDECLDHWVEAEEKITALKLEIEENDRKFGSMSKAEEQGLLSKKVKLEGQLKELTDTKAALEEDLNKWRTNYENLSKANTQLNNKIFEKSQIIEKMTLEDQEEDQRFKEIITDLNDSYFEALIESTGLKFEKALADSKIKELTEKLRLMITPEHSSKLNFAVRALQLIDNKDGDYYDLIANKVVTFKVMKDCKNMKDFLKSLKALRKACRAERKMLSKIRWSTFFKAKF